MAARLSVLVAAYLGLSACHSALPVKPTTEVEGAGDAGGVPEACRVVTQAQPPFAVTFEFANDGAAPVFLARGCVGTEYGVSSCASGFADRLGPAFHCACACRDAACQPPACGACPDPSALQVAPGKAASEDWSAVERTHKSSGGSMCIDTQDLPAGRYRLAIRVYESEQAAIAGQGGRLVAHDFELPAASNVVRVRLRQMAPSCEAAAPVACQLGSARERPCALGEGLSFEYQGGFRSSSDRHQLIAPRTFKMERSFHRTGTAQADQTCAAEMPVCSFDAREVTTADIARAVSAPKVAAAFAVETPVYGLDARAFDGSITVVTRADGKSLGLGAACTPNPKSDLCMRALEPGMAELDELLGRLRQQMLRAPGCVGVFE